MDERDYLIIVAKMLRKNPTMKLKRGKKKEVLKITDEEIAEHDAEMKRLREQNEREHQEYLANRSPMQRKMDDLIEERHRIVHRLEVATDQKIYEVDGDDLVEIFEEFSDNEEVKKILQEYVELVGRYKEWQEMN